MFTRTLLIVLLLLTNGVAAAKPSTELTAAVHLAEAYIAEHKILNGNRYLASVAWHEDMAHPEKSYWSIMWVPNELAFDAQLVVWVFADGTIKHQDSWA
ncbi:MULTISPECIES: hypothetical protein [unclassified Pseudoxanthomonas]|uniref:hypothetical protein n=1 Tax=unclassified Pseudoxanthomonas TaxID=2645906 RepID=UPI0030777939